ncbi:hypothetical protein AA313_de0208383 [Arthrobotrys entomopaga]|nr:hypothetical protein AA313_de0208383 [Arthrobotrys entomopaga]
MQLRGLPQNGEKSVPRVVCYYQTHFLDGKFVSILPLVKEKRGATHVVLAAIHLNAPAGNITLNDDPYKSPKYEPLWAEIRQLQGAGIKVLGMLGGAAQGSFSRLDGTVEDFHSYYEPLREMIAWTGLDGLDLDVEEAMSLAGVIKLIDYLKTDFGSEFIITLAPVATAMQNLQNLAGFDFETLERAFGHKIAWYNTQFYCGWGDMRSIDDYEKIVRRGWQPDKIVVGLVTNPANCRGWVPEDELRQCLTTLVRKYPNFGGVMGWEYFNSVTNDSKKGEPWKWAALMSEILNSKYSSADSQKQM